MNLSIWHCLVLYCCRDATIERLAEKADLSVLLLNQAKNVEKWDLKKAQFNKLSVRQKASLDILELLFGDFQSDESKKAFIIHKVIGKGAVSDDFSRIIPEELSIQDKLDSVNSIYKYQVSGYNGQLANCQKILKDTIKLYFEEITALKLYLQEITALKAIRPQSNDFEEIAERLHTFIYNNYQFLSRLIKLYNEMKNFSS